MTKRRTEHDFTREPAAPATVPYEVHSNHLDDAEISRQAGRLLGRLKRGDSTEAVLKGTLELLLDMHR